MRLAKLLRLATPTLFLLASLSVFAQPQPIVSLTQGQLAGRWLADHKGATFRGVPFAAPPVGDLRWRAPQAAAAWKGVRDATKFAPSCAQVDGGWNHRDALAGSEDCLYLNISTPEVKPSKLLPVYVWIHGGANFGGSALGDSGVDGALGPIPTGGFVQVSIQYRLGMLGFLSTPELDAESATKTSGNFGLMDQVAALKWVQANIAKFGGDPAQVTIGGESAGAYNVALLMATPLAKGLFIRAIEESAPSIFGQRHLPNHTEAIADGDKFIAKLGAGRDLKAMRAQTVDKIITATPPYGQGGLGATMDGYVFAEDPAETYLRHHEYAVPLLVGSNSREFPYFAPPETLPAAVRAGFGDNWALAFDRYGLAGKPTSSPASYGSAGHQFSSDQVFRCYTAYVSDLHETVAPLWQYEFAQPTPGKPNDGAPHASELAFVFGGVNAMPIATEADKKTSELMIAYWANFITKGDPNGATLPKWEAHKNSRAFVTLADGTATPGADLRGDVCRAMYANESKK